MRGPLVAIITAVALVRVAQAAQDGATTPDHAAHGTHADGAASQQPPPLYDDLGVWHHAVSCTPPAQAYFDQGLRLIYAFNHDEAIRAFREAARRDPRCAMAWWGVGLALGPNYNLPIDPPREAMAVDAVRRARAAAPHASPVDREYVAALAVRYAQPSPADRRALDRKYAEAMGALARRHPDDVDASVLYAEALMDLRPWALWNADGTPAPDTDEIVRTLEGVLAKAPNHPGANHYYVHAVEASPHPERATASAERLPSLMPGAGHIVHMPSHVWMRTGRYADATESNAHAIAVDEKYLAAAKPQGVYPLMYVPHNIHFLWSAASMEGRSAEAIAAARRITDMIPPEAMREMPMLEYFEPTAWFALVRFGRWQELAAAPPPAEEFVFATAMWRFTQGLARANLGDTGAARARLAEVQAAAVAIPAERIVADNQPAAAHVRLAAARLAGEIALREGRPDDAVRELQAAVAIEDALPYTEPPPWFQPTRHVLGAALLTAHRPAEAEAVYREDLRRHPDNGWALRGLAQSLRERDAAGSAAADERFRTAWRRADVQLATSRF